MHDDLKARIEDLPPELYNQIRNEVLIGDHPGPEPDSVQFVYIEDTYKYPITLNINRHYRHEAAEKLFTEADFGFTSIDVFRKFYTTFDPGFLRLVNGFTIMYFDANQVPELEEIMVFTTHMQQKHGLTFTWRRSWPGDWRLTIDRKTVELYFVLQKKDEEEKGGGE